MLKDENIISKDFSFEKVYCFKNQDLINLAFPLNNKNINMSKLAIFRLKIRYDFGAMWLSDYIDNGYLEDIKI